MLLHISVLEIFMKSTQNTSTVGRVILHQIFAVILNDVLSQECFAGLFAEEISLRMPMA